MERTVVVRRPVTLIELRDLCDRAFPNSWLPYEARSLLGDALAAQKKYAQAEPLLIEGYEGLAVHESSLPASSRGAVRQSLQRLVDFYTACEKPAEAEKWQSRLNRLPDASARPL